MSAPEIPKIDIIALEQYERSGTPHEQWTWLRHNDPVHWHYDPDPSVPGFWAITKLEDIVYVSRNPDLFSAALRTSMFQEMTPEDLALQQQMMLFMDPPKHTRQRSYVNRGFTPRMINRLREHIEEITHRLIDDVCETGEAEFVRQIAAPLPLQTICELMGAPLEDADFLFEKSNELVGYDDPELQAGPEAAQAAAAEIYMYAQGIAEQRKAEPRDDIATKLLQPDENGNLLTDDEFNLFILMLTIAGNETTRTATAGGILAFFEHPDQWERLKADPSLISSAADEIVRWTSPLNLFRRTATQDVELRGKKIKAGDKVVMFYPSGNRDEEHFENPFSFDIGRGMNPHIGFGGGGPHYCLGTHLARMNLTVLFGALAERLPDIQQAGPVRRMRSNFVNGFKEIPVRFTPTPRRS
ncbi:cytochrome P450 [Actinocorallia sp. A-T 12471]|uniref:cytochrome P450 n=1 Tax=Actinocorallia sp. A-T 12471 TaxID=3089813 RepID=UPI0029CAF5AB|nr:cytochrome P450 [Actinocorallia sp. A-T 12471]MDX6738920.1 cytochrome P450 [Actinocorallia sp. A-T 12471]